MYIGFVEITASSSNNGGGRVVGLLCMGRNRAGSNLAVHFDFFSRRPYTKQKKNCPKTTT